MTDEEKKAKRAAYNVEYKKNLSRFQKEKRRLATNKYRNKKRSERTPEEIEKQKEYNKIYFKNYYEKNIDKYREYNAAYRNKKKVQ